MRSKRINFLSGAVRAFLLLSGLKELGRRNLLGLEVKMEQWDFPSFPEEFSGLRILHLSDLHIDLLPAVVDGVIDRIKHLDYDLTVMTGDYQDGFGGGAMRIAQEGLSKLREAICGDIYFVLGNHDDSRMLEWGNESGLMGLNDHGVLLREGGANIFLGGLGKKATMRGVQRLPVEQPEGVFSILLSHSPENARVAARDGVDFFLAGHTHGGQICLPGGKQIWALPRIPREFSVGRWRVGGMSGYTSRGIGGSGVAARFNCPPEVTLHLLKKGREDRMPPFPKP